MTIKHDDPQMIHLRNHFDYLHKLGEVRATEVIVTVVDGARVVANRQDTDGNIYLPISMGYHNCCYRYMESLGYKVTVGRNGTLKAEGGCCCPLNILHKVEDRLSFPQSESADQRYSMLLLLYLCK